LNYAGKFDANLSVDAHGSHPHEHVHVETITKHAAHVPAGAIIVPDAQLLFNEDFKRSGVDLVLTKNDHELVLQDYFKGEKRAALASPDGARLSGDLTRIRSAENADPKPQSGPSGNRSTPANPVTPDGNRGTTNDLSGLRPFPRLWDLSSRETILNNGSTLCLGWPKNGAIG
jgi:hypothetical protein